MFKAVNRHTSKDIIILDAQWAHLIQALRLWGHQGDLVCPAGSRADGEDTPLTFCAQASGRLPDAA